MNFRKKVFFLAIVAFIISACNVSFAEDITPPPGYRPPEIETPVVLDGAFPIKLSDTLNGGLIYIENCLPCHGDSGLGDGPSSEQLAVPVAPIGIIDLQFESSPLEWFSMITLGNIDSFMPPFSNALSDQERWDVLSYVYSLGINSTDISAGETIFESSCLECHSLETSEDNPENESSFDFSDQELMVSVSGDQIVNGISAEVADENHNSIDELNEQQKIALVAYMRSLTFPDITTEEFSVFVDSQDDNTIPDNVFEGDGMSIALEGMVEHVSSDEISWDDRDVTLVAVTQNEELYRVNIELGTDGNYTLDEVQAIPGIFFYVQIDFQGVTYYSETVQVEAEDSSLEVPALIVYEVTQDTSTIVVDQMLVFFSFISPDIVEISEWYVISNLGEKVVSSTDQDLAEMRFTLPEGVDVNRVSFRDGVLGERFLSSAGGFVDMLPVYPSIESHLVVFAYSLPYKSRVNFERIVNFPVNNVIYLLPEDTVSMDGSNVSEMESQTIGDVNYIIYKGEALDSAGSVRAELNGRHPSNRFDLYVSENGKNLSVGIVGFGLMLFGMFLWLRQNPSGSNESASENIIDEIIELDELYEEKELEKREYLLYRRELKNELRNSLQKSKKKR